MSTTILIGLDDTDNATSRGTGHLARRLLAELAAGGCRPGGVTRHQFPLDRRIPYTSHNSGACLSIEAGGGEEADVRAVAEAAARFVGEAAAEGSDPGLCVARLDAVGPAVRRFARRATAEIVEMDEAAALAEAERLDLRALGGSGLGVIGALASVGLRAGGNEGRFIDLPGLRELPARVTCRQIAELGIRLDYRGSRAAGADDECETLDWVRPRLAGGRAVLPVHWCEQDHAWKPVDNKRSRPLE